MIACVLLGACSSSAMSPSGATPGNGASGGGATAMTCAANGLHVLFSPMYSAFDGTHTFKVPSVVQENVDPATIKWGSSDPTTVDVAYDATLGGAMITIQKAGSINIVARAPDGACGASMLVIAQAAPTDWDIGRQRYNNGVVVTGLPRRIDPDAAMPAACTNCHGDTAMGPYKTVSHTPEQTAGFSDAQLMDIFMNGTVPSGGSFDTSVVSYDRWQTFHRWAMSPEEAKGIIVYLRSLTPQIQTGARNRAFGGSGGMGGMGPVGCVGPPFGPPCDGGEGMGPVGGMNPPPSDAGTSGN